MADSGDCKSTIGQGKGLVTDIETLSPELSQIEPEKNKEVSPKTLDQENEKHGGPESEYESAEEEDLLKTEESSSTTELESPINVLDTKPAVLQVTTEVKSKDTDSPDVKIVEDTKETEPIPDVKIVEVTKEIEPIHDVKIVEVTKETEPIFDVKIVEVTEETEPISDVKIVEVTKETEPIPDMKSIELVEETKEVLETPDISQPSSVSEKESPDTKPDLNNELSIKELENVKTDNPVETKWELESDKSKDIDLNKSKLPDPSAKVDSSPVVESKNEAAEQCQLVDELPTLENEIESLKTSTLEDLNETNIEDKAKIEPSNAVEQQKTSIGSTEDFIHDDLNLSGEMQGDLLDEEGLEGGMEGRADFEDEFPDGVGDSLLDDDIDGEKAVTFEPEEEEDDEIDLEATRRQIILPEEKDYQHEDMGYEEGEAVDDEDEEEEYVEGEREQGDGEESVSPTPNKEKVLDDDEDRRNPQYIPKKGAFYEHDDRLTSDQEQVEEEKEVETAEAEKLEGKKKKLWSDDGRWNHDMFNQDEQAPKSKDELLNSYGYDIRSEDCPPRARRRRRYGRGPNKYTRNWQDEDAYHKGGSESGHESEGDGGRKGSFRPQSNRRGNKNDREPRRGRGNGNNRRRFSSNRNMSDEEEGENFEKDGAQEASDTKNNNEPLKMLEKDFPPLSSTIDEKSSIKNIENVINIRGTKAPFPAKNNNATNEENLLDPENEKGQNVRTITFENSRFSNNRRNSNESKPAMRDDDNLEPRNFDRGPRMGRGRGRGREHFDPSKGKDLPFGQRSGGRGVTNKNRGDRQYRPNNFNNRNQYGEDPHARSKFRDDSVDEVSKDIPTSSVKDDMVASQNKTHVDSRPKRYSSLRQRGGPETGGASNGSGNFRQNVPPPRHSQNQQYYDKQNNYKPVTVYPERMSLPNNQPVNHSSPVNPMIAGAPIYSTYNAPYQEPFAMRPNLSNAPRMYPPPPAQPVAITPPYMTQPPQSSPAIINYVPGPNHPPPPSMMGPQGLPQYPYQQYNCPQPTSSPPVVSPAAAMGTAVVVSQPQEVYRGGVTYYNTQSQQLIPMRMPPQRRAKTAIPIVDPTQESLAAHHANMQMMAQASYPGEMYGMQQEEVSGADGPLASSNSMPLES